MLTWCNRIIQYSFYTLLLCVPLIFFGDTSELFEFNKLWLTFILTIIIGAAWISKMIVQKRFFIQRTPLDIPILLFLLSQIISTIISIDHHISVWGYYSRFNGGLLSIISYIFLYYALVSNIFNARGGASGRDPKEAQRMNMSEHVWEGQRATGPRVVVDKLLKVSLLSGLITSLWGLPSHFGYDPTCLIFRGTFDVGCWTAAFQPKVRIFSTLGQPDWLAAYLSILIPIALAYALWHITQKKIFSAICFTLLSLLFYIDLLFTSSKSSFLALLISLACFFGYVLFRFFKKREYRSPGFYLTLGVIGCIFILTFFIDTPLSQINKYTFHNIYNSYLAKQAVRTHASTKLQSTKQTPQVNAITGEFAGTDSGKIRLFVWRGAIDIWKHYPLFGSGVETFAYAYYQFRPAGHNLTSEWDYLYNKAHNEYLNYLATTGAFGLGTYLAIIGVFLFLITRKISNFKVQNSTPIQSGSNFKPESSESLDIGYLKLVIIGIISGYLTIIISNFFGFSVVIVNIYFFLLPLFVLILTDLIAPEKVFTFPRKKIHDSRFMIQDSISTGPGQHVAIVVVWLIGVYLIIVLLNYWNADRAYGLGMNLDHAGDYQQAYQPLHDAATARTDEPVFTDEVAINDAVLAQALVSQKNTNAQTTTAQQLAQEALTLSEQNIINYPYNVSFWKSRIRVLYTLSQVDPKYLPLALAAAQKTSILAPTDAKIMYNLGLLYSQNNQLDLAITTLTQTTKLKADYRDAYYALGILLHAAALDKSGKIVDATKQAEAIKQMTFIAHVLSPGDKPALEALKSWGVQ